ncbi:MAG: hypothetical protein M1828_002298 [Chrysothrix sp. TS-e1954]|nr:MAG: hypothetical protein M1828_002298 [Chrysothrix sp. TS-e1954]
MSASPITAAPQPKLHGRAFYQSIGSPKVILAPMVDQSEFAWRLLTRSFMDASQEKLLSYTPMLHSRLFGQDHKYRRTSFEPTRTHWPGLFGPEDVSALSPGDQHLDGNPKFDRPLIVQFCTNAPEHFLQAAKYVEPFCDAVDLNLGCPQGIARKGNFGSFLQEDTDLIYRLINSLHKELSIPVTAKMRVLETNEKTLAYAKKILSAGASILTVHGRQRDQKGHKTGLADWSAIRYLRQHLPSDTVLFANGNILRHEDIEACLEATGADGVMVAEANLHDPSVLARPPAPGEGGRDYWRGKDDRGGYRMDAGLRRYLDIIHTHVMERDPPTRKPLFLPSDPQSHPGASPSSSDDGQDGNEPPNKRQKTGKPGRVYSPNLRAMQAHLFGLLRPLVSKHTNIRDALAKCRPGDIDAYEHVLTMVEEATRQGLIDYENGDLGVGVAIEAPLEGGEDSTTSSLGAVRRCRRPWWICQPYVRPLPQEALDKGSIALSKKEKARIAQDQELAKMSNVASQGTVEPQQVNADPHDTVELPKQGLVCG